MSRTEDETSHEPSPEKKRGNHATGYLRSWAKPNTEEERIWQMWPLSQLFSSAFRDISADDKQPHGSFSAFLIEL